MMFSSETKKPDSSKSLFMRFYQTSNWFKQEIGVNSNMKFSILNIEYKYIDKSNSFNLKKECDLQLRPSSHSLCIECYSFML